MKFAGLIVMAVILFAATGARAKDDDPVVIRITMDGDEIEFSYHGRKLSDSKLDQLCAASRRRKADIEFRREKMTRDNALAAILKEAQCLGAAHAGSSDREPESNSGSHTHAKPRHRAAAPR